jgi:uncharacterized protein (TIRG00374 family)
MSALRWVGLAIGVAVLGLLIHQVGFESVRHSLALLGWGYGIVLLYPMTWMTLNTAGWWTVVKAWSSSIRLMRLMAIRLAGEAFNTMLPSGYVGGEPLKAKLLAKDLPLAQATSSVLIAKAAQSVGLVFFIGLGLTWGGRPGSPSPLERPAELMAFLALAVGIAIFIYLLANRAFGQLAGWLHHRTGHSRFAEWEPKLRSLDEQLGTFYRKNRMQFLASTLWHLAGWLAGALELVVIFTLLGVPFTPRESLFMGALAQLGAVVGLFAPAGVGLYEGGHYLAAELLGLSPELGVSVALIRRVRELAWNAVGVGLFWRLSRQ